MTLLASGLPGFLPAFVADAIAQSQHVVNTGFDAKRIPDHGFVRRIAVLANEIIVPLIVIVLVVLFGGGVDLDSDLPDIDQYLEEVSRPVCHVNRDL